MAEIDPGAIQNLFGGIKTVGDYNQANQAFLNSQGLAGQQLQNLKLTGQTQANTLATQILSAAASTGSQAAWDQGKQTLQNMGIDTSMWAPDVQSGQTQVTAAKLAQSPLGPLLDAAAKQQQANATTAGVAGVMPPATPVLPGPLGAAIQGFQMGGAPGAAAAVATTPGAGIAPRPALPTPSAAVTAPAAGANGFLPPVNPNPMVNNVLNNATNTPNLTNTPAQAPTSGIANVPNQISAAISKPMLTSQIGSGVPGFVPPDTTGMNPAAANAKIDTALKQYMATPAYDAAVKMAQQQGTDAAEAFKTANAMQSNLPQALQRFNDMRAAAQNANWGLGSNNNGTGITQIISNARDTPGAAADTMLEQRSAQSILPEIGPIISQTGGRGNQFMERMGALASGLDLTKPPDVKIQTINTLENAYISNLKANYAQMRANGMQTPSDADVDAQVASLKQNNPLVASAAANTGTVAPTTPVAPVPAYGEGAVVQMPDGSKQLFSGGQWRQM